MSKALQMELKRLKQIGGQETLASELEAFLETVNGSEIPLPYSRLLLANAAQAIRDNALDLGHDFIGASVESFLVEREGKEPIISDEVVASLSAFQTENLPKEDVFAGLPLSDEVAPEFEESSEDVIAEFANILVQAGYVEEACKYLLGYNELTGKEEGMKVTEKKALMTLRDKFRAEANLNMVRAIDQVLAEGEEEPKAEEKPAEDVPVVEEEPKTEEAPVADQPLDMPAEQPAPEGEEKPVLEVEPATPEEIENKEKAATEAAAGNFRAAGKHIRRANALERNRIIAALVRQGDFELAMEGLAEAEADGEGKVDDVMPEEKNAGMKCDEEECKEGECKCEEGEEMPVEAPVEEPAAESKAREEAEEVDEKELASCIASTARRAIRKGNMKAAKEALADLNKLEKAIVEGVRVAEQVKKDMTLAAEGYGVWKAVRSQHLKTVAVVAEAEGDEKAKDDAAKGLEALEADEKELEKTLDGAPAESKEITEAPILPPGGHPEMPVEMPAPVAVMPEGEGEDEVKDEEKEEGEGEEKEVDSMKYEVLQSADELKNLKIDRSALAFTLWNDEKDPYWVIQAAGKPIAEVHLADQDNAEDIHSFFCNQDKWPNVIAQTTEKVGLYDMLQGIKARFYCNAVEKSALASKMRASAVAELSGQRTAKLANLRRDYAEAIAVAAEQLNKGLIPGKPNSLKKAFAERLASLGIHNPGLVVEDCFAEGFAPMMDQVMTDADELMEMPKEAFAHTKKMVGAAANVAQNTVTAAYQNETLAQRLGRTSMPFAATPEAQEAPAVQREIEAAAKPNSNREKRAAVRNKLKLSTRF